jgi:hypothetical protein
MAEKAAKLGRGSGRGRGSGAGGAGGAVAVAVEVAVTVWQWRLEEIGGIKPLPFGQFGEMGPGLKGSAPC